MTKKLSYLNSESFSKYFRYYSIYTVLFFLYLASFIFVGFFLHIYINSWTLITAFVSYGIILLIFFAFQRVRIKQLVLIFLSLIITSLVFWGLATVFGHTYDTSYDGQDYHQSAVIELSDKWNPIYQKAMPIKLTNKIDGPVVSGYGKIIWAIDSSIYKLTHNIDSATVINLIVGMLAFSFVFFALRSLKIDIFLSSVTSFLIVVTTIFVEQIFTLREDSISYGFFLIGVSSAICILVNQKKLLYFWCLVTSLIFLAGTKYSNLFIFIPLLVLSLYVVINENIYKLKAFKVSLVLGIIISFICLFNPYITNIFRYHAIDYPFNQKIFANSLKIDNIPSNIRNDGKIKLLYYGIFSSPVISDPQSLVKAHIKAPFTLSYDQLLIEAMSASKTVGGYGVFFGGIFILSLVGYLFLFIKRKSQEEKKIFWILSLALISIITTCLLSPVPNYARYGSQLFLFPISIVLAFLVIADNKWTRERIFAVLLIILMFLNIILDTEFAAAIDTQNFQKINSQLTSLKDSNKAYLVYSGSFYSVYAKLKLHGINYLISQKPINCNNIIVLDDSGGSPTTPTDLCRL